MPEISPIPSACGFDDKNQADQEEWTAGAEAEAEGYADGQQVPATDGALMVGKICRAVYAYQAQNSDELEVAEEEQLTVLSASDQDWVAAQNVQGASLASLTLTCTFMRHIYRSHGIRSSSLLGGDW